MTAPALEAATPIGGEERGSPQRALFLLLGLTFLAFVGLVIGFASGYRGPKLMMVCLAILTAWLAFLPIALDQTRPPGRRHVLLDMIAIVFIVNFVLPVFFTEYLSAKGPVEPADMAGAELWPRDIVGGQVLVLAGLCFLYLGYAAPITKMLAGSLPTPRNEWTQNAALFAGSAWISWGVFVFMLSQFGAIPAAFGSGVLGGMADASLFGAALLLLTYVRHRTKVALLFLIALVGLTSSFNFFTGSKRLFLSPFAVMVIAWMVMQGRFRLRWFALGATALVLLYPVAEFYRYVVTDAARRSAVEVLSDPSVALRLLSDFVSNTPPLEYIQTGIEQSTHRLDALGRASVIIRDTPSRVPFQNGRTIGLIAVAYIPRILWPEKPPINIGQWITTNYGSGGHIRSNTGPSWIGEFYLNFGTVGVLLGMAFLGVLFRLVHEVFRARGQTSFSILVIVVVAYKMMASVGGGIVTTINGPIFSIAPLLLTHLVIIGLGGIQIHSNPQRETGRPQFGDEPPIEPT